MRLFAAAGLALALSLAAPGGRASTPWPEGVPTTLAQPVNDLGGLLSPEGAASVDSLLRQAYDDGAGPQVAVLVVKTLGDRAIEDVAITVARGWGLGDKVRDDGVLLLIATQDHKLRIEVGKRIEGQLTDVACQRIISDVMAPRLRSGDSDGAVLAGVSGIINALEPGSAVALSANGALAQDPEPAEQGAAAIHHLIRLFVFLIFFVIFIFLNLFRGFGSRRSSGGFGSGFGGGFGGGGGGFSGGGGGFSGGGSSGGW